MAEGTVSTGGIGADPTSVTDASELLAGQMVGEYAILGPLGAGGMGRVYSAEHPVIAKKAAIKVLHPELSVNKEAVDRFVQEARSVNQIGHPNIVDIFSFGTLPDGRNYFVMEWLRGESLRDRVERQRMPVPDVLAILETITLPLEAAHEQGIVHRDLKPDNVFLVDIKDDRPQVKLLDFGIAKLMGTQGMQRTQTGNMLGTPGYMSPEQARGENVDYRTDIYALGAVAFELLTGELPFVASNAADMIAHHLLQPPRSAHALDPTVPPELDALVVRMLAKAPHERPSLDQIRNEMRALRMLSPASPYRPTPPPLLTPTPFPAPFPAATPYPPPSQLVASQGHTSAPMPTLPPAEKRSRGWLLGLGLLVVLGAAGAAVVMVSSRESVDTKAISAPPASDPTSVETRTLEAKPVETKPVETKPVETKPIETKPVETRAEKQTDHKHTPTKHDTAKKSPTGVTGSGSAEPFDPDAPM